MQIAEHNGERAESILLNELDLGVDGLLDFFLPLVVDDLLLLEQVPTIGVDGHDQGPNSLTLLHHRVSGIPSSSQ